MPVCKSKVLRSGYADVMKLSLLKRPLEQVLPNALVVHKI